MRFLLILLIALLVFNRFGGWLGRHGFGKLPGDLRWRVAGREFFLPVGSGLLLTLVAWAISRIR